MGERFCLQFHKYMLLKNTLLAFYLKKIFLFSEEKITYLEAKKSAFFFNFS